MKMNMMVNRRRELNLKVTCNLRIPHSVRGEKKKAYRKLAVL
jgi:hypothetical protein